MRKGLLLAGLAAALLVSLAAEPASARRALVGIGDQKTEMFSDPRLPWLGVRKARLVVPWFIAVDGVARPDQQVYVDQWLRSARRAGVEPMVAFGHGFEGVSRIYMPTLAEYTKAITAFRQRWPWVRTFITWNETNHCSQPTCHRPTTAAKFYDVLSAKCRGCRIVAAALIDQPNMVSWLRKFRKAAKRPIRILGLHNYLDVNRLRTTGTKRLLKAYKGKIWITETGGLVYRQHYNGQASFPESKAHAAKATRFALKVTTRLSPRIERVYLYHWNADRPKATWDSGLIDWNGKARPAFDAVARYLGKNPRMAPKLSSPPPPTPTPFPTEEPPAAAQPEPSSTTDPPPSSTEQPPPAEEPAPTCPLLILCPGTLAP